MKLLSIVFFLLQMIVSINLHASGTSLDNFLKGFIKIFAVHKTPKKEPVEKPKQETRVEEPIQTEFYIDIY